VRLLLATAGGEAMDATIRKLAAGPIDWDRFLGLVVQERGEAIVSARLGRVGVDMPATVRDMLRALAIRSDLRMAVLSQRLDQTIAALTNTGIPVLLLKGAALGRTLYRSLPRRPMLDLDLLVPEDKGQAARQVALATDWVPGELELKVAFYEGHYHLAPLHDGRGLDFNLEIHTALFPVGHPFNWPAEELWARSRPLAENAARIPSIEDLLLHVALHFFWSHAAHFGPWRTFRDVRVIAEDRQLDWDAFVRRARASRGGTAAFWTLRLARLLAGAAIPPGVEQALRPSLPALVLPMLDRHFAGLWLSAETACPSQRLDRWLWRVAVQPGRSGHGKVLPWERERMFRRSGAQAAPESSGAKLMRHLGSPRRYFRYLHRIALGSHR
jgi:hypothetical protein